MSQPPIEDYALLSDRQTAALVAHGRVDWWCVPRFDSASVFGLLIGGEEAGYWSLLPQDATERHRAYREGAFLLDTHWDAPTGHAVTTDFLRSAPVPDAPGAPTLVRQITCTAGSITVAVELRLRFDYGETVPWVHRVTDAEGNAALRAIAGPHSVTLHGPQLHGGDYAHHGTFELHAGETLTWTLAWQPSHVAFPCRLDVPRALEALLADWNGWRGAVPISGPYADAIAGSLAVLRALTHRATGGIVAAPTTSLPEDPGGERNWDYRYTWLRDSAFTIQALATHGHVHTAQQWREWLLRAIAGDPEDLQIMYGLAGERKLPETTLDHLPGYHDSRPVRIGNGAHTQYQADVVGEVMLALDQVRAAGVQENTFSWALQVNLLQLLQRRFGDQDHGIWEARGDTHYFTHGRVMMWAAFDCGIRAAERYGLTGPVEQWREHRERLRTEIWERGVHGGTFVQHYDTDAVDAALLQLPQTGFVAADSDVMRATVARIEAELLDEHGFVRRYVPDGSDGVEGGEGSFLMCSFWLVEQYAASGRGDDARALFERLLALRNDVGLLSEEYDAGSGHFLGNVPQAFSHLALIRAAEALRASVPAPR